MAVVSYEDITPPGMSVQQDWVRGFKRTLRVLTDNATDGPITVRAYLADHDINIGKTYGYESESDIGAVVNSLELNPDDDGLGWTVTVNYGAWPRFGEVSEDPLDQPPEIDVSFREFESPVERDVDGNAILNSAADPYNPTLSRDDSRLVVTVVRNEPAQNLPRAAAIRNTVNQYAFMGFEPRMVKAAAPKATLMWHPNVYGNFYWKLTYTFEVNDQVIKDVDDNVVAQGWDAYVLDAGFNELDVDGNRVPITLSGEQPSEPVPLDGNGAKLASDADPVFLAYKVYPEYDYSFLDLS